MLSIGEFARFAGVSVRMLRHYDALGLLQPASVDPVTGYRRYAPDQLVRANGLVALKGLGFSLDQVGTMLDRRLEPAALCELLATRREELQEQIAADQARLADVERRLRLMEGMPTMQELEFIEKELPALELTQLTGRSAYDEVATVIGPLFDSLVTRLTTAGVEIDQPAIAWYSADDEGLQMGAGFEVPRPDGLEVEVGQLPAVPRAVTTVYRGSMERIGEAWQALGAQVTSLGLEPIGPCREVYLQSPMDDADAWVTELQQPVS